MLKIFVFIDIWFVKQDIHKWLKNKDMKFLWRIWKIASLLTKSDQNCICEGFYDAEKTSEGHFC